LQKKEKSKTYQKGKKLVAMDASMSLTTLLLPAFNPLTRVPVEAVLGAAGGLIPRLLLVASLTVLWENKFPTLYKYFVIVCGALPWYGKGCLRPRPEQQGLQVAGQGGTN